MADFNSIQIPTMTVFRNLFLLILSGSCHSEDFGSNSSLGAFPAFPSEFPVPAPADDSPVFPQIEPNPGSPVPTLDTPDVPKKPEPHFPQVFPSMADKPFPHQRYFDVFAFPSAAVFPIPQILPSLSVTPDAADFFGKRYALNFSIISERCPPNEMYGSFNPDHQSAVSELLDLYEDKTDIESLLEFSGFTKSRKEIHPHVWYAAFMKAQLQQSPMSLNIHRPSAIDLFPSEFFPDVVLKDDSSTDESFPVDSSPDESIPVESIPVESSPDESSPVESSPVESSPVESSPVESSPVESSPVESSPDQSSSDGSRKKRQIRGRQRCATLDGSIGRDNGPENALWYFREDVQLNAHHFLWHLEFPIKSARQIPRRGEFFYFVHHDLLARYRTERVCNGMNPVDPAPLFLNVNSVLAEGYNPHLTDGVSTQKWAPRPPNSVFNGNTLAGPVLTRLRGLSTLRQRIIDILNTNAVNLKGRQFPLTRTDNINMFGEMLESSAFSANPDYYGQPGLHNDGHYVIASVNNLRAGSMGVMGHSATAMRDIAFYRIHAAVDNIFNSYKSTSLPPYQLTGGEHPLVFSGISVDSFSILSDNPGAPLNVLGTFWSIRNFTLEGGLDYNPNSAGRAPNINVCAQHLNHEEFTYTFQVNNARGRLTSGFFRIYMAPRFKSSSSQDRYTMEEQRTLFFMMDSFVQPLQPGVNTIRRSSLDSALTAPWPRSIQQVRADITNKQTASVNCECGFPHHLLLPKGTAGGMIFDVLVHVTDASQDYIPPVQRASTCTPSHIHCGIVGQQYPDAKPMAYPFDRRPYTVNAQGQSVAVSNLDVYVSNIPNMATNPVRIIHRNIVL